MITVVVPVFNEEQSLRENLPRWLNWCGVNGGRLIVVDDGSTDRTIDVLAEWLPNRRLKAFRHQVNRGYGAALKTGIFYVETPFVATMDGDGQHRIEDVGRLFEAIQKTGSDMVIGARPSGSGGVYRRVGKAILRWIARILFGARLRDLNSGLKLYRTKLVQRLLPFCPGTMAFSDIAVLTHLNLGCSIIEVPVQVAPRRSGVSTISTGTAIETLVEIVNALMWFKPLKVFIPLSVGLATAGVLWAIPFLWMGRGLSSVALLLIMTGLTCGVLGLIAEQLAVVRRIDLPELLVAEVRPLPPGRRVRLRGGRRLVSRRPKRPGRS